jgi:hypothetical protein
VRTDRAGLTKNLAVVRQYIAQSRFETAHNAAPH